MSTQYFDDLYKLLCLCLPLFLFDMAVSLLSDQGRRTKNWPGGGRIFWACAREARAEIFPPLSDFFPTLSTIFTLLFQFFSLYHQDGQIWEAQPGELPPFHPRSTPICIYIQGGVYFESGASSLSPCICWHTGKYSELIALPISCYYLYGQLTISGKEYWSPCSRWHACWSSKLKACFISGSRIINVSCHSHRCTPTYLCWHIDR